MLTRLNGWQRIGIVISALWLGLVTLLGISSAFHTGPFGPKNEAVFETVVTEAVCSKPAPPLAEGQKKFTFEEAQGCATGALIPASEKRVLITPAGHEFYFGRLLAALIIPVLFFWLFSYSCVAVFKWVAKGFRKAT